MTVETNLRQVLEQKIPALRDEIKNLVKNHANETICHITLEQAFGGMRNLKCLICDTSSVEPDQGLIIRGRPVAQLVDKLPEEILYLLLTGDIPDQKALGSLQQDLSSRQQVPDYVWKVLRDLPATIHPMVMLSTAILVMEGESVFRKEYTEGLHKDDFWKATLEDALTLIARVPVIAAGIYRLKYKDELLIPPDPAKDMGANLAHMLGLPDPNENLSKLLRLFLVLHSDHENGNVSALTTATVNSALSDLYYAVSAGLNGLAGPLHGLANQECLKWILDTMAEFKGVPTNEELEKHVWDTLNAGRVVPGYGHAVLRITDPRFTALIEFGKKFCPSDPVFQTVEKVYKVAPEVLKNLKKIKDPWPNVDAASGSLLYHYGIRELEYYTVLFGVSRTLGICSQNVIYRGLESPIIRPKSVTTEWIKKNLKGS